MELVCNNSTVNCCDWHLVQNSSDLRWIFNTGSLCISYFSGQRSTKMGYMENRWKSMKKMSIWMYLFYVVFGSFHWISEDLIWLWERRSTFNLLSWSHQNEEYFIRLVHEQTIFPGTFTFCIPASKLYKMLFVVPSLDSSKVCPAPTRLRWATVLP